MTTKEMKEHCNSIQTRNLKDFEEYCDKINLDNVPPPPPLRRSYKTSCLCGNRAYVYNKQREGGVCGDCEYKSKISKL